MRKYLLFILICFVLVGCNASKEEAHSISPAENTVASHHESSSEHVHYVNSDTTSFIDMSSYHQTGAHIENTYHFIPQMSSKDCLYFEQNISTLGFFFIGLEPANYLRCKTQILKYDLGKKSLSRILVAPNIPAFWFGDIAPYANGFCTSEIGADSNGNIIDSIISQYDVVNSQYDFYRVSGEGIPRTCSYDEHRVLCLNFIDQGQATVSQISILDTATKMLQPLLQKRYSETSGTVILNLCSENNLVYTVEQDALNDAELFFRCYDSNGTLQKEFTVPSSKIGSSVEELHIKDGNISIKTNSGHFLIPSNQQPFKIPSINLDSSKLFYAGNYADYVIYSEKNLKNTSCEELVVHTVHTKTLAIKDYIIRFDDERFNCTHLSITPDNTVVGQLDKTAVANNANCSCTFFFIEDFIPAK